PDVVEEAAGLDKNLENFGEREESSPKHGGPLAAALFKNDFEDEGFTGFGPRSDPFTHVGTVCPSGWGEASGQGRPGKQIPNSKRPSSKEAPSSKLKTPRMPFAPEPGLGFGIWSFSGACGLALGVSLSDGGYLPRCAMPRMPHQQLTKS